MLRGSSGLISGGEVVEETLSGPTADYIAPRAPLTVLCDCKKSDDQPDLPVRDRQLTIWIRATKTQHLGENGAYVAKAEMEVSKVCDRSLGRPNRPMLSVETNVVMSRGFATNSHRTWCCYITWLVESLLQCVRR